MYCFIYIISYPLHIPHTFPLFLPSFVPNLTNPATSKLPRKSQDNVGEVVVDLQVCYATGKE